MKYQHHATQQQIETAYQQAINDSRRPGPYAIVASENNGFEVLKVYGFNYPYEVDDYVRQHPNKIWVLETMKRQKVG